MIEKSSFQDITCSCIMQSCCVLGMTVILTVVIVTVVTVTVFTVTLVDCEWFIVNAEFLCIGVLLCDIVSTLQGSCHSVCIFNVNYVFLLYLCI